MGGLPQIVLFAGILSLGGMLANLGRSDVQEISFQHFKTHLLAQGLVEKVEVANKASAKVYVRAGSARCAHMLCLLDSLLPACQRMAVARRSPGIRTAG